MFFFNTLLYLFLFIIGFIIVLVLLLYCFYQYKFLHWKKRGIQGPTPSFPEGNVNGLLLKNKHFADSHYEIYHKYKHLKYVGFFNFFIPILMINDIDIARNIMFKDGEHFDGRGYNENYELEPLAKNLFVQSGDEWKYWRTKLSICFTPAKIKGAFPIVLNTQRKLYEYLDRVLQRTDRISVKVLFEFFTVDVIGQIVFATDTDVFENHNSTMKKYFTEGTYPPRLKEQIAMFLTAFAPEISNFLKLTSQTPEIIGFYTNTVTTNMKYRWENNVTRNDIMQALMDIYETSKDDDGPHKATMKDLIAQSAMFVVAGHETSTCAASFALIELALNPHCQEKAREQIFQVIEKYNGELSYEAVQDMYYLDMVVNETLRLHPTGSIIPRKCSKRYKLDEHMTIEKGEMVAIPVIGIYRDERYYPNPEKFDPNRFTREEKSKRDKVLHMPFSAGARTCIGKRLGMLDVKMALMSILKKYKVELPKDVDSPLRIDPKSFGVAPTEEVMVILKPLKKTD